MNKQKYSLDYCLQVLLADAVTMKFTAHGYHWNVEGPDFAQYHELFANIYEDVDSSIDPIAENIRKLDCYAPFALQDFVELRTLQSVGVKTMPLDMAKALLKMNDGILLQIDKAFKEAVKENQQGIANFLAERDDMHKKWRWQLRASIK
jgi:starvation-inducible DNA-binding protein